MSARQLTRWSMLAASAVLTIAALLMAGCGVQPGAQSQTGGAAPTPTSGSSAPHLPTPGGSTPDMTNIVITTDQQSYKPGDTIHVTITNHTATPIFATSGKASCTVVEAQMKTTQGWQTAQIAPCADATMAELVQIAPKASRSASITAKSALASGTYRLALSYSTYTVPPPQAAGSLKGGLLAGAPRLQPQSSPLTTVYSQAFTVA
ncbi:MAG TPA: hypothetical protein VFS83_03285 [Ktedonobacterales bacterium]|nr:hypothetical protein [Ktedonobacterales bacterium]